jgi:uncharacterized OB-fold protein
MITLGASAMSVQSQSLQSQPYVPIREGLFQPDPPALLGSTCNACGTKAFPARDFCPHCHDEGPHAIEPLARSGTVFSYTVVHQAPGGRPTPYVLAYIDLDDSVRVLAQLSLPIDSVSIGMRVGVVLRQVGESQGVPVVGYVFTPETTSKEVQQ